MRKKLTASILALGTSLAGSLFAGAEDLTIVFKARGPEGEGTATHYLGSARARFDQDASAVIADFATGRVWNLSLPKKEYSETTFAEMERVMTSTSAEMEKAMAGIPEGLRQKMMGDAAKEVVVKSGETLEIAGVPCQVHVVALGHKTRLETCTAAALEPPFDPAHFRRLPLLLAPVGPGSSGINKMVEKLRDIPGICLAFFAALQVSGRKVETAMEATEIRKGPIDAAVFEIPPGFKKVDHPWH